LPFLFLGEITMSSRDPSTIAEQEAAIAATSAQAQQQAEQSSSAQAAEQAYAAATDKASDLNTSSPLYERPSRSSWTLTTEEDRSKSNAVLEFYVNPNQYTYDIPFRQVVAQAKGGPVIHTFRDNNADLGRNNTNLGFGTLTIEFNSGSILPRPTFVGGKANPNRHTSIPYGLLNYTKYLELIQQDTVYRTDKDEIVPNYAILTINTLMFPFLELFGFFVENHSHQEQAEDPTQIQSWSGKMQIYKTNPSLTGIDIKAGLDSTWLNYIDER